MKKIKRFFLKPVYCLSLLWCVITKTARPINFNHWLSKNGYWRLTNWLDNFKVIVPKDYSDMIKKFNYTPYIDIEKVKELGHNDGEASAFRWYEGRDKDI